MSIKKKIVWLPYDLDTALGINNEGSLVFNYELEDTDHLDGADVYNGQDSVLWNNIRMAFHDELAEMYKTLRSTGALSYDKVEKMFEEHQAKWPEAIVNEDEWFKYIEPLINDGSGAYLEMLQGTKAEQRKWWLYNRFRYIDSKYNAGDALANPIQLRGYTKADITITPYADIYPTVKYGSYLVGQRGKRGVATTLVCPLDVLNDTEIYIYSPSQLQSVGDLSGLNVGFADFSTGTKLQDIKLGDSTSGYQNTRLNTLTLGNNILLKTLDVRNCVALGTGNQKSVDISGCTNIENVYFDGTAISGLTLPNGGVIKKLHLPATMTNLTILNQKAITEFVMPSYANISTLRLENVSSAIDSKAIVSVIPATSRVRLIGIAWECQDADEISDMLDILDTMRGLDENGNNVETAQVSGTIHTSNLTGDQIEEFNARYPYLRITADHIAATVTFKTWDGETTIDTVQAIDGELEEDAPAIPERTSTAQYTYTAAGWADTADSYTADSDILDNVTSNMTVYAAYTRVIRTYTVTWKNKDNTVLETDLNVPYGTVPHYDGTTPSYNGQTSTGWDTDITVGITGDTVITAEYKPVYTATFKRDSADGGGTLYTQQNVVEGTTPVYGGATPTTTQGTTEEFTWTGWSPALGPIYANTTYTATFRDKRSLTVQYLSGKLTSYESTTNNNIAACAFYNCDKLESAIAPALTVSENAFYNCSKLSFVDLSATSGNVSIGYRAFYGCTNLTHLIIRSNTMATMQDSSSFEGTKIYRKHGAVYVPENLVTTYKNNSMWSKYIIASIDQYPLSQFESISDSWSDIIANNNYATDYKVGDTKVIDLGSLGKVQMELVAIDTDNKADNSGNARMTWISNQTSMNTEAMNNTQKTIDGVTGYAVGGWEQSDLRAYLKNTVKPLIPVEVRNAIVPVTKVSSVYENGTLVKNGQITTDDVWIPSAHEAVTGTKYETDGPGYTISRVKIDNNDHTRSWWLRSGNSNAYFYYVNNAGDIKTGNGSSGNYIVFGFCI